MVPETKPSALVDRKILKLNSLLSSYSLFAFRVIQQAVISCASSTHILRAFFLIMLGIDIG